MKTLFDCASEFDPNAISVKQARSVIHQFLEAPRHSQSVPLDHALGQCLAQDIVAPFPTPPHDYSAMDGYALALEDSALAQSSGLPISATWLAGHASRQPLTLGTSIRIMTGAPIPPGADAVVMQERTRMEDGRVVILESPQAGQNIRRQGEDLNQGEIAIARGTLLEPTHLGLLASLGFTQVETYQPIKVAFFTTGDELVEPGQALGPGQIYDSNRQTLRALLQQLGVEARDLGRIPDDPAALKAACEEAAAWADAVISCGGVSVGEADFVKTVMAELGEVVFWKLALKPGRPFSYGRLGRAHFFGLPGNPVAVVVTYLLLVREALLKLSGITQPQALATYPMKTLSPLKKSPGRTEYQRGIHGRDEHGQWWVKSSGNQSSGVLSSLTRATCLIVLPQNQGSVNAGEWVEVLPLNGLS
jgi:molybdopterin molybdotransferase